MATGKIKRLLINLPPRAGKSRLSSIEFPEWYLGQQPDKEVILVSYADELAVSFGRKVRNEMDDQIYQNIFDVRLSQDSKSAGRFNTDKGGGFFATGIGGGIVGRGCHILLIDDIHKNREEADSEVMREKVWDYYRSTLYTRLAPNAAIVILITRWHEDDLVGRLMREELTGGDQWEKLILPAIAERNEEFRKEGEVLWPQRFDKADVDQKRIVLGNYEFSCQYQQTPIASEYAEFKSRYFLYRQEEEVKLLNTRKFATIDTALSKNQEADYTGIIKNDVDLEGKWNIRAIRLRMDAAELVDYIFRELVEKEKFEVIGIEETQYLFGLKPYLESEMRRRNKWIRIIGLKHKGVPKELRIRSLLPRYESGRIIHIRGQCDDLEKELLAFPGGRFDDLEDSLAYQSDIVAAPYGMSKMENQEYLGQERESFNKHKLFSDV